MLHIKSFSVVSKKVVTPRHCLVFSRRPFNISKLRVNKVHLEFSYLPLPSSGGSPSRTDLNKKSTELPKKLRYIGYADQRTSVTSINIQEAKQFNERLCKTAELYDGWFSRNVENLDLAPIQFKVSPS